MLGDPHRQNHRRCTGGPADGLRSRGQPRSQHPLPGDLQQHRAAIHDRLADADALAFDGSEPVAVGPETEPERHANP